VYIRCHIANRIFFNDYNDLRGVNVTFCGNIRGRGTNSVCFLAGEYIRDEYDKLVERHNQFAQGKPIDYPWPSSNESLVDYIIIQEDELFNHSLDTL
jgi:hypothetical protein